MKTSNLLEQIEDLRKSMIEVAVEKGFSSEESIIMSHKLDQLLNQYEQEKRLRKHRRPF